MQIENIVFTLIFVTVFFLIDLKNFKQTRVRDKIAYIFLTAISLTIIVLFTLNIKVPSPSLLILKLMGWNHST